MIPPSSANQGSSTRPYLIRALHDWCTDNGFTPYVAVFVDSSVRVPMEYVKNNEIVLNVGFEATTGMTLGNEFIEFKARFGGVSREIIVPVDHVIAIYARENGQGMAFPAPTEVSTEGDSDEGKSPAERPAPTAGLRLASTGGQPASESDDVAAAEEPSVPGSDSAADDDTPPPPEAPSPGGRPALKRIK